jgi:hypothetical protein
VQAFSLSFAIAEKRMLPNSRHSSGLAAGEAATDPSLAGWAVGVDKRCRPA